MGCSASAAISAARLVWILELPVNSVGEGHGGFGGSKGARARKSPPAEDVVPLTEGAREQILIESLAFRLCSGFMRVQN